LGLSAGERRKEINYESLNRNLEFPAGIEIISVAV
jgi:hypothetical protein